MLGAAAYFELICSPEHHHFVRHFAVLFDAPVEGACGLEIANLAPPLARYVARVYRVDCQLRRLGELKISDFTF